MIRSLRRPDAGRPKLKAPITTDRKFEDVVKSAQGYGSACSRILNKETRNAGEKPVHGFMDSLLNSKAAVLVLVY
jgi:hypothetical protein